MFLLRRTAVRAISATPSKAFLTQPRFITSVTPATFRLRQQQGSLALFQRRFASDDVTKTDAAENEDFAQTAAEAPIEENLTPAQEEVQAEPAKESFTMGIDALQAAEKTGREGPRSGGPRQNRDGPAPPGKMLYIGNLFWEVTQEQLERVFSRFGEIASVRLIYDNRGMSRGFGYVEYKNIEDAQSAIDNLDMQVFEGRNLVVQFHREKNPRTRDPTQPDMVSPPSDTLFVGNMSFEMSDKDLNDLFRDVRNVVDVRVAIDRRTGQPRGFAHAEFVDVESATRAKEVLSEKSTYGRQLRVDFSKSSSYKNDQRKSNRSDSVQGS